MNRILLRGGVAVAFSGLLLAQDLRTVEAPVKTVEGQPAVAPQPGVPQPGTQKGNSWFPVTDADLGVKFHHEEARHVFPFKNPTGKAIEWKNLTGSCTCSKAVITIGNGDTLRRYELSPRPVPNTLTRYAKEGGVEKAEVVKQITLGPGDEGQVEVHMEMHGITGVKQASLDMHTTDPELPMVKLKWHATGAQLFVLSPPEVNLNQMTWNEKREFTVTVTSPVQKDFNITRIEDQPKDFDVKWEKAMRDGIATWTISGTYGPITQENAAGGVVKFFTDLQGEPNFLVRVMAMVKGPLEVKPGGFLTLGMIRKGTAKTEKIVFEPNDGSNLEATAIRFEKLTIDEKFITATPSKDGNKLVVTIDISGEAPAGLLRGDVVVELNHPAMKDKRILFNGFIR
ncbi:MAG: hypothetical protein IPK26_29655 [Planctomycetes bacterium]|nr:hypothetical protein [Planctomycetota bacterium]